MNELISIGIIASIVLFVGVIVFTAVWCLNPPRKGP